MENKQAEIFRKKVSSSRLFGELAGEYMTWAERQRSFRSKYYLIKDLWEKFGNLPLMHFTTRLVEQYQTELIVEEYKPASVNRYIASPRVNDPEKQVGECC